MKKRITAIALTLALTAAMAVPASAATITEDSNPQSGTTTLSIGVQPTYSVIIPDTIQGTAMSGYSASQYVTARDVQLAEGAELVIDLSSDFEMTLEGGTDTLAYTMTARQNGSTKNITAQDTEVARFSSADGDQSVLVGFAVTGTPTYAGTYSDLVTFTVSVEQASTQTGE